MGCHIKRRKGWVSKQRAEQEAMRSNFASQNIPGTPQWAFYWGPDIVKASKERHPEWFGGEPNSTQRAK